MVTGCIRLPHSRWFMWLSRMWLKLCPPPINWCPNLWWHQRDPKGIILVPNQLSLYIYIMNQREYTWINYKSSLLLVRSCEFPMFQTKSFPPLLRFWHSELTPRWEAHLHRHEPPGCGRCDISIRFSSVSPFKMNPFGRYIQFSDSPMCEYTPTSMVVYDFSIDVGLSCLI